MQASERASKKTAEMPDIVVGDHVFVQHPTRGPVSLRVTALGRDGFRGVADDKTKHGVPWGAYLGHKARGLKPYDVVDQGADGAIVADERGKRRYVAGDLATVDGTRPGRTDAAGRPARQMGQSEDDPLLDGMNRLEKALSGLLPTQPLPDTLRLFVKATPGPIANRPGLHLEEITDKLGHQTHRWESGDAAPAPDRSAGPPMKHGDKVRFRHGNVEGEGKIIASSEHGVTLRGKDGTDHHVHHQHLINPDGPLADDKAAAAAAAAGKGGKGAAGGAPAGGAPAGGDGDGEGGKPLFDAKEVESLPAKAVQPIADKDALMKASAEGLEHFRTWLNRGEGVASQAGAETMTKPPEALTPEEWDKPGALLFIAPLKGNARAEEKVRDDYGGNWAMLKDTVRGSIAVDTIADLHGMVGKLKAGGLKLAQQPKDRFAKPTAEGYRDMLLNVTLPNGLIGELQLHVKPMLKAKNEGHHDYEVSRTLVAKQNAGNLSDAEARQLETAIQKQRSLYSSAWEAATGVSGGAGGMMTKAEGGGFSFHEKDGAYFRRRSGMHGVQDVLHGNEWKPYAGDCWAPIVFGDEVSDPLGGEGGKGSGGDATMAKADGPRLLLLKAQIPNAGTGDLFAAPVHVSGHMRDGVYIAPFTSIRHKRPDISPTATEPRLVLPVTPPPDPVQSLTPPAREYDKIPESVLRQIKQKVHYLNQVRMDVLNLRQPGMILASDDLYAKEKPDVEKAKQWLENFRPLAAKHKVDFDKVLTELGSIPDIEGDMAGIDEWLAAAQASKQARAHASNERIFGKADGAWRVGQGVRCEGRPEGFQIVDIDPDGRVQVKQVADNPTRPLGTNFDDVVPTWIAADALRAAPEFDAPAIDTAEGRTDGGGMVMKALRGAALALFLGRRVARTKVP